MQINNILNYKNLKIMSSRSEIINSIHSMNKALTYSYLEEQTDDVLLNLVHPLDRNEYAYRLKKEIENKEQE